MNDKFKCEKCVYAGAMNGINTFMCYAKPKPFERHCSTLPCIYYKLAQPEKESGI